VKEGLTKRRFVHCSAAETDCRVGSRAPFKFTPCPSVCAELLNTALVCIFESLLFKEMESFSKWIASF